MMIGYLFLAIAAGSVTSLLALISGASLIHAICIYTLAGTLTLVALNLVALLMGVISTADDRGSAANSRKGAGHVDLAKPSIHRL